MSIPKQLNIADNHIHNQNLAVVFLQNLMPSDTILKGLMNEMKYLVSIFSFLDKSIQLCG